MSIREKLSGNEAAAIALKQINPDVMAAFPITPSTEIPQYFSKYVANGSVDTEFVPVESEHSAMSACVGSQAAGARTVTATSSCGLALMFEELYIASSSRLPIILSVVNRALSGPININADHSDSMGARDSGWIQLYSEDNQEAYDNLIQAVRIGEHEDVQLPVMVCQDGFITSHAIENIELLEKEVVQDFVGDYQAKEYLLNKDNPIAMGPYDTADYYMEHKYQQNRAMENAKAVIEKIAAEFKEISGREYDFFETYKLEDADYAMVVLNSTAGTAKAAIDKMRAEGKKVGLLKIRVFRPFNAEKLTELLKDIKYVAVMDRSETFSTAGGPVFHETSAALYPLAERPELISYIYGLGGRDVTIESVESVFNDLMEIEKAGEVKNRYRYLGLRE
ncbi:2-ketoisovalerate ferredoxin oxidoreductase subunit alpha [Halanaerobium praevalens]|uniref:Pyruvate ferredoxin oxidoreductase, alpha subunit n=1 Tax=Halanaerobium praevalens (strain ATCC 33744 / DSM 2228 / GSL) TaxID=572479 RepID=E3DLX7_HALPG|nr:2-ketoisovalerate ferredoxin oxidoreductase subunit alpha [Halanaerobium praevalens]ADO76236.1 pyruvate ferredoxin oxidoreductase, alpha subunit [Halanaerobium praevalens DSM 2228]